MASGKRGGHLADIGGCGVGLGLKTQIQQWQQHQQQQQERGVVRKMMTDEHGNIGSMPCSFGDAGRSVAFTADQRQEFERQTVIYKYMMACMPVPPQLLLSLSKHPMAASAVISSSSSSSYNLRYTTGSGGGGGGSGSGRGGEGADPEPWRCRRTDGKKWRCSRDVAPDLKYCERHSHKGRPSSRSRKPVESLLSPAPAPPPPPAAAPCNPIDQFPSSLVQYNLLPNPSYRYMKKDAFALSASPQCQPRAQMGGETQTQTQTQTPFHDDQTSRPFIDAWSLADANVRTANCPTPGVAASSSSPIHSILPLTLSVSSGTGIDHADIPDVHDHEAHGGGGMRLSSSSSQPLNWMASWSSSPPGGPLAEALCLGMSGGETGTNGLRTSLEDTNEQLFRLN